MRQLDAENVKSCAVAECDRRPVAKGWCMTHYQRMRRTGKLTARPKRTVAPPPRTTRGKLTKRKVRTIRKLWAVSDQSASTLDALAAEFGVHRETARRCIRGWSWPGT